MTVLSKFVEGGSMKKLGCLILAGVFLLSVLGSVILMFLV